jgi:hypothetical protein
VADLGVLAVMTASPTPRPSPAGAPGSGDLLTILALIVSAVSLVTTTAIGYLQFRSQARLTAIEQGRRADELSLKNEEERRAGVARVTVQWQQAPPALILRNHGPAPAIDVHADVASAAAGRPPPGFQAGTQLPLRGLGPDETYVIPMTHPYGVAAAIIVELRWHDRSGPQHRTVSLSAAGQDG